MAAVVPDGMSFAPDRRPTRVLRRISLPSNRVKDPTRQLTRCHSMLHANAADVTVLWATPDGVRCVVRPYDEDRFQLKLVREQGTIRSDLFARYADAVEAAHEWRRLAYASFDQ